MNRLSERKKSQEQLSKKLIPKGGTDKDIRINIVVKASQVDWLDQEISGYNAENPRTTNRSEVIRLLIRKLQQDGLDSIV